MSEANNFPIPAEVKELFRKFAEQTTGWHIVDPHIKKISVRRFSNRIKKHITSDICVGQELDENLSNIPHEPVLAIFKATDANEYLVVTPDKGKSNSTLYMFEPTEVLNIEEES